MKTDKIAVLTPTMLFGSLAEEELHALAAHLRIYNYQDDLDIARCENLTCSPIES